MTVVEINSQRHDPPGSEVSIAELLTSALAFIDRFVVLPSEHARTAIALYVAHTHAVDGAHATPYLALLSAEKGSGKTRSLEVLGLLVRSSWHTSSASDAALFRKIASDQPTLLLDEIDAMFGSNSERTEPIRAVLNAGNRRGAATTRVVGKGSEMKAVDFPVFCPKVLAGIDTGRLPETVEDRSIVIKMKRRRAGETVERFRHRFAAAAAEPLRDALAAWAQQAVDVLGDAVPDLPDELGDRAGDGWEPLLAIADIAGSDWSERARAAAVSLSGSTGGEEVGRGKQLLAAVRSAITGRDQITTADLLQAINENDELPFGGWSDGKGLDARSLARLLKPYDVKPRSIRVGDSTPKGYRLHDLEDAFARYLEKSATAATSTTTQAQPQELSATNPAPPQEKPLHQADVARVADVAVLPERDADGERPRNGNGHKPGWTPEKTAKLPDGMSILNGTTKPANALTADIGDA